jgi:hypothetical protein
MIFPWAVAAMREIGLKHPVALAGYTGLYFPREVQTNLSLKSSATTT